MEREREEEVDVSGEVRERGKWRREWEVDQEKENSERERGRGEWTKYMKYIAK